MQDIHAVHVQAEPVQVCEGDEDAGAMKGLWPVLPSLAALVFPKEDAPDQKLRKDIVKETTAAMQSGFVLRSASSKLRGYGPDATMRCKADPNQVLLKLILHQQNTLLKALGKVEAAKATLGDAVVEGDVASFDLAPLRGLTCNPAWADCVKHLAKAHEQTLDQSAEELDALCEKLGASGSAPWKKDLKDADWATVRRVAEETILQLDGTKLRNLCNTFLKDTGPWAVFKV